MFEEEGVRALEDPLNMSWRAEENFSQDESASGYSGIFEDFGGRPRNQNGCSAWGGLEGSLSENMSFNFAEPEEKLSLEKENEFFEDEDFKKILEKSPQKNKSHKNKLAEGSLIYCSPKRRKAFHQDEFEKRVKGALDKLDLEPDLIGDFTAPHQLPTIKGKHQDLKSITPETLKNLIEGKFASTVDSFEIIDSRFPYEFQGGHVEGAINIYKKEQIVKFLHNASNNLSSASNNLKSASKTLSNNYNLKMKKLLNFPFAQPIIDNFNLELASTEQNKLSNVKKITFNDTSENMSSCEIISRNENKENLRLNKILIFHCEFSMERGPSLARLLRRLDREKNSLKYPRLVFPEIYILDGGYREYYKRYPKSCVPELYIPMLHPDFSEALKQFKAESKPKGCRKGAKQTQIDSFLKCSKVKKLPKMII